MFRGLWKLTWLEFKIFMREPMGSVTTLIMPAVLFIVLGKMMNIVPRENGEPNNWISTTLPVLVTIFIALNGVISLAAIMSIYREAGILKRLKATPLEPYTILTAHVLVKLGLTAINIATLIIVGKTFFAVQMQGSLIGFCLAVAISTVSILSLGFVIASVVPTARFAQVIATTILYPLLGLSGLFAPLDVFPPAVRFIANLSPLTHAVTITKGTWLGAPLTHFPFELFALAAAFVLCVTVSSRIFRWE